MPISIDWGTKVITIPQSFLTFISGTTYLLNIDAFRLALKNLEDDFEGMPYLDTHRHVAPITLSGTTYSRFVEIINDYTVTFEDGFYQVNLSGANSNIVDVLNRNSVSVVANNSSGLISLPQIEYSSYQNRVTIDTVNGSNGTEFPIGTVGSPVNNIADALAIAQSTGITQLFFNNSYTIPTGIDLTNYELVGVTPSRTTLVFISGCVTSGTEISNCTVQGEVNNVGGLSNCHLLAITDVATVLDLHIHDCVFEDALTFSASATGSAGIFNSKSGVTGQATSSINFSGSQVSLLVRDFTGGLQIENMTAGNVASFDFLSGQIVFDSSCTDATVVVRGLCKVTNNALANPNFTLADEVVITAADINQIASAVWDKLVQDHLDGGTFGERVGKKLLTSGKYVALK